VDYAVSLLTNKMATVTLYNIQLRLHRSCCFDVMLHSLRQATVMQPISSNCGADAAAQLLAQPRIFHCYGSDDRAT
jgi:hypothetical protein